MKRIHLALIAIALVAAACATDETTPSTTVPGTTTDAPTTTTSSPGDPDRLVLQLTNEGGFLPRDRLVSMLPRYSLYADGRLYAPAPVPAIYPGPIVQPLQVVSLSADALDQVNTLVDAIGLREIDRLIDDSLRDFVMDAGDTLATLYDEDGAEHVYGAYALGLVTGDPTPDATRNLELLVRFLDDAVSVGSIYQPHGLQLWIDPTPITDPEVALTLPWFLEATPDDFQPEGQFNLGCHTLLGGAAQQAIDDLASAHAQTLWFVEEQEYLLIARPLLPGDPGCTH